MSDTVTNLLIAFIGAFAGAWLSVYLAGVQERSRERAIAVQCTKALREITTKNLENIVKILDAQEGGGVLPNQVLPALHVSIYEALLPQLPTIGVSHKIMIEVAKTYAFLKDMQELHYTILNLNLEDIAPMRDALRRSEPIFTNEAKNQLASLNRALEA